METQTVGILNIIKTKMSALLSQKNYPCVAALKSFNSQDFEINTYQGFGSTESSFKLADDLMKYAKNYEKTKSPFFTFWAVYPDTSEMSEESFEDKLWKELSALASHQEFSSKSPF
ncbi:MAG: YqcI/YcgG family protein [Bdellovibrio sp.]|nr:YqcI/YcgG family protein [Bdellovibrio sp.]